MNSDRIKQISVRGLRCLEDVTLDLGEMTVLVGENGSGKSSIVEACELLRRAGFEQFVTELNRVHGGLFLLLRYDAPRLELGVEIEGDGPRLSYRIAVTSNGGGAVNVEEEHLDLGPYEGYAEPLHLIDRTPHSAKLYSGPKGLVDVSTVPFQLLLHTATGAFTPHPGFERTRNALRGIDVHIPFDTLAHWVARATGRRSPLREESLVEPTDRLERLGSNLVNAFNALKNEFGDVHWRETMELVRLGLGHEVESVNVRTGLGGGSAALSIKVDGRDKQFPLTALADGWLAYLGFVALFRLGGDRSLLVLDEPEIHLHPGLVGRIVGFLESIGERTPVVIATHSDRLLDSLSDPAGSVAVCEIEQPMGRTCIRRLDRDKLHAWLETYMGVGSIRSEGHMGSLLQEPPE
ncbi:MAG: AAA family ATPase [Deltaproteobacteria bacterium]|nr:AAA family ATPase [Deltaproteobacteria bacterium]